MTDVQIKVEGLKELREVLLRDLPDKLQGKALQGALKKGADLIVREAKRLAPRETGRLRRAIYSFRDRDSRKGYESRLVGVRSGKRFQKSNRDAFYWKFVEFGHRVAKRGGGYLKKTDRGGAGAEPTGVVPPQPFMRPAFESQKLNALKAFEENLKPEIRKVAERATRRSFSRLKSGIRRSLIGI